MKRRALHRLAGFVLSVSLLCLLAVPALAVMFSDSSSDAWYGAAVEFVKDRELMSGTGNDKFSPESPMTRAMLVTVLHRMEGAPAPTKGNTFSDVPEGAYYTEAVTWAAEHGIVVGIGQGWFEPHSLITREQMAAIFYRYADYRGFAVSNLAEISDFPDSASVSAYAEEPIRWAIGAGLLVGNSGRLLPAGQATRAQAAVVLMRFVQNILEKESETPETPNVPSTPNTPVHKPTPAPITPEEPVTPSEPEEPVTPLEPVGETKLCVVVQGKESTPLYATLADNSSVDALKDLLGNSPLTLSMSDYANMEKGADLGTTLPENNEPMNTVPGDIILYQGRTLVIYYSTNSWSLTPIGKISGVEEASLREALGAGNVTVTFSLE